MPNIHLYRFITSTFSNRNTQEHMHLKIFIHNKSRLYYIIKNIDKFL